VHISSKIKDFLLVISRCKHWNCKKITLTLAFCLGGPPAFAFMDLDGNGYSDFWEKKYGASNLHPFEDSDGDGEINLAEHHAGTDPLDGQSKFTRADSRELLFNQLAVGWKSSPGVSYDLEASLSMEAGDWENSGIDFTGNGEVIWARARSDQKRSFFRVKTSTLDSQLSGSYASRLTNDTDGDGVSDWKEWMMKTNIFDPLDRMDIPDIRYLDGIGIRWQSQLGKHYQLESRKIGNGNTWENHGPLRLGTGGEMEIVLPFEDNEVRVYSMTVQDLDSDGDGLTDWEEGILGLRPDLTHTDHLGDGDLNEAIKLLGEPNKLTFSAPISIANVTRGIDGMFEIRRLSGVDRLEIELSVSGDASSGVDFQSLPTSVVIPFGEPSVTVPVRSLQSASVILSEEVTATIASSVWYDVEGSKSQTINLVTESAINVRDFGAVGDGVTDDRAAIQSAIDALEVSADKNALYFPEGQYALNSYLTDSRTGTSLNRILKLGTEDLAGRDLMILFDEGASLYSTVSPVRAHILECEAKFRSLSFYDAQITKDDTVLEVPRKAEPNGADGISLVLHDLREIEMVQFLNCRFSNCHGAISTYGSGFDTRGKLKYLRVLDCEILNPWGANSIADPGIWGGGQLVNLLPWVGTAEYYGNYFDGGSKVQTHPQSNPLGREKDGSHFGSPLRLIFSKNTVEHMRVEAVFHAHDPLLGYTDLGFTFPPVGDEVVIQLLDNLSSFEVGDKISIRGAVEGTGTKTISLTIAGYQKASQELRVRNDGENSFPVAGIVFPDRYPIYLQGEKHVGKSFITDNVVRGFSTAQSVAFGGIVVTTNAFVSRNYVEGFASGILIYENLQTPLSPPSKGSIIENNTVHTAEGVEDTITTYGIQSFGLKDIIRDNLILTPAVNKVVGIALRGEDSIARRNQIIAESIVRHSYSNSNRSVGIGVGNSASLVRIENNTTRGFDVGVGPVNPFQAIPHYASGNESIEDFLAQDSRGLIMEN